MIKSGIKAPSFSLPSSMDGNNKISLEDFIGNKSVILAFYPADDTPVCTSQLSLYNEINDQGIFDAYNAQLLGISVDTPESHKNFAQQLDLSFPLLADSDPAGEIARIYGVWDDNHKISQRALFVIDVDGIIQWSYVSPLDVNPGADGILEALEKKN